jgi:hypothetical protein
MPSGPVKLEHAVELNHAAESPVNPIAPEANTSSSSTVSERPIWSPAI